MSLSRSGHAYQVLKGPSYVRLLTLLPRKDGEHIRCTLRQVCLDDPPEQYYALSYVWGEPEPSRCIIVDDRPFTVRQNLYDFLCSRPDGFVDFFVDALCINQEDLAEREQQVGIMHRVYSCAREVHCWLGPADPIFDPLLDASDREGDKYDMFKYRYHGVDPYFADPDDPFHKAVVRIHSCPYFSRIWIIAELPLSARTFFWIGTRMLPVRAVKPLRYEVTEHWQMFDRALKTKDFPQPVTLSALAGMYGTFGCSLLHDKVYAMWGVVQAKHRSVKPFPIRYNEDLSTLFARVLAYDDMGYWFLGMTQSLMTCLKLSSRDVDAMSAEERGDPTQVPASISIPSSSREIPQSAHPSLLGDVAHIATEFASRSNNIPEKTDKYIIFSSDIQLRDSERIWDLGKVQNKYGDPLFNADFIALIRPVEIDQESNSATMAVQAGIKITHNFYEQEVIHLTSSLLQQLADLWKVFFARCRCTLRPEVDFMGRTVLQIDTTTADVLNLIDTLYGLGGIFEHEPN